MLYFDITFREYMKDLSTLKTNILYQRVSSKSQEDNTSLEYQRNRLDDYCKANSVGNTLSICDVDSGANTDRKGITTIETLIQNNSVDTIYITKLDRLYRSVLGGAKFIQLCLTHNVSIQATDEPISTKSPVEMLQINMLLAIADFERSNIKSRTLQGKQSTFSKGNRAHGNIAFGYKKSADGMIVDEPSADVVKKIFRRYSKTKSLTDVKNYLHRIGARASRNKSFARKSIYNILKNRVYVGDVSYNGDTIKGNHIPIVSKRLFTAVNN